MKVLEEYRDRIDKSGWEPGPWNDEPDKVVWIDEATDLDCMIRRNPMGVWCGYVGVPEGHPWFGKDYDDLPAHAHGGLTFADRCHEEAGDMAICHIPQPGRPEVWWLGFDCGHGGMDFIPSWTAPPFSTGGVNLNLGFGGEIAGYKTQAYVVAEVESLAQQVKAAA